MICYHRGSRNKLNQDGVIYACYSQTLFIRLWFKQWWSAISPILTKRVITYHPNLLNTNRLQQKSGTWFAVWIHIQIEVNKHKAASRKPVIMITAHKLTYLLCKLHIITPVEVTFRFSIESLKYTTHFHVSIHSLFFF